MCICKFCGKNFEKEMSSRIHQSFCKQNPDKKIIQLLEVKCSFCGKLCKGNRSLSQHENHCELNPLKKTPKRECVEVNCSFCNKSCKSKNSLIQHEIRCNQNPNKIKNNGSETKGHKPGNQYLKAEELGLPKPIASEEMRKKISDSCKGRKHSEETKKKISEKLSVNNKGGRCKWFEVSGQKVQGTWEKNIAEALDFVGIDWRKLKVNKDILKYKIDGREKSYTPDFYLPKYDVYLEIKGFWWGNDKQKMKCVLEQHEDKNIIVIGKQEYLSIVGDKKTIVKMINNLK